MVFRKEIMDIMHKFWIVKIDGTASTSVEHPTYLDAINEAQRLLNLPQNAGRGATILEAIEHGRHYNIRWEILK